MTKTQRELRHPARIAVRWTRRHLALWILAAGAADTAVIALLAELLARPGQSGSTVNDLILVSLVPLALSVASRSPVTSSKSGTGRRSGRGSDWKPRKSRR